MFADVTTFTIPSPRLSLKLVPFHAFYTFLPSGLFDPIDLLLISWLHQPWNQVASYPLLMILMQILMISQVHGACLHLLRIMLLED